MNAATLRPFCPVSPFCPWAKGYFLLDINITACQTQGEYKSKMRTVCLTAFSKDSDSNSGTSHNFGQDLNCGSGSATELLSATSSATAKPFIFQRLTSRVADLRINLLFLPVADDSGLRLLKWQQPQRRPLCKADREAYLSWIQTLRFPYYSRGLSRCHGSSRTMLLTGKPVVIRVN